MVDEIEGLDAEPPSQRGNLLARLARTTARRLLGDAHAGVHELGRVGVPELVGHDRNAVPSAVVRPARRTASAGPRWTARSEVADRPP